MILAVLFWFNWAIYKASERGLRVPWPVLLLAGAVIAFFTLKAVRNGLARSSAAWDEQARGD